MPYSQRDMFFKYTRKIFDDEHMLQTLTSLTQNDTVKKDIDNTFPLAKWRSQAPGENAMKNVNLIMTISDAIKTVIKDCGSSIEISDELEVIFISAYWS